MPHNQNNQPESLTNASINGLASLADDHATHRRRQHEESHTPELLDQSVEPIQNDLGRGEQEMHINGVTRVPVYPQERIGEQNTVTNEDTLLYSRSPTPSSRSGQSSPPFIRSNCPSPEDRTLSLPPIAVLEETDHADSDSVSEGMGLDDSDDSVDEELDELHDDE